MHPQNWNTITGESAVVAGENYPGYYLRPIFPATLIKKVK
jgi:hypothetical protein